MKNTCLELVFPAVVGKEVCARWDGGDITSDAGVLLVSLADRRLGLTEAMADCINDTRQQSKVEHSTVEITRERVYAICQGYEDANDLDVLGCDPALKTACTRLPNAGADLASQPTISRFENMACAKDQVRMAKRMAQRVISRLGLGTRRVILDVDPTDAPCHGQQEFEFFNGHYGEHCYLPLHVHITGDDGRQRILGSLLRPGNSSATRGLRGVLRIAVRLLRKRVPNARIILRADSAFGVCAVLEMCDELGIDEDVYEFYCAGGEQENRIKEMKLDLSSGRTSCCRFLANQFRLLMHTAACMLMCVLQDALAGTRWAKAQIGTLRARLLKVGARIAETTRKIWFHLPSSFPEQDAWRRMYAALVSD